MWQCRTTFPSPEWMDYETMTLLDGSRLYAGWTSITWPTRASIMPCTASPHYLQPHHQHIMLQTTHYCHESSYPTSFSLYLTGFHTSDNRIPLKAIYLLNKPVTTHLQK
jgi:hypothetical protein